MYVGMYITLKSQLVWHARLGGTSENIVFIFTIRSDWILYFGLLECISNLNKVTNSSLSWNLWNDSVLFWYFYYLRSSSASALECKYCWRCQPSLSHGWLEAQAEVGALCIISMTKSRQGGHNLLGCVTNLDNKRLKTGSEWGVWSGVLSIGDFCLADY